MRGVGCVCPADVGRQVVRDEDMIRCRVVGDAIGAAGAPQADAVNERAGAPIDHRHDGETLQGGVNPAAPAVHCQPVRPLSHPDCADRDGDRVAVGGSSCACVGVAVSEAVAVGEGAPVGVEVAVALGVADSAGAEVHAGVVSCSGPACRRALRSCRAFRSREVSLSWA